MFTSIINFAVFFQFSLPNYNISPVLQMNSGTFKVTTFPTFLTEVSTHLGASIRCVPFLPLSNIQSKFFYS